MSSVSQKREGTLELYQKVLACQSFDEVAGGVLRPIADHLSAQTASFRQFHFTGDGATIGHNCCLRVADQSHSQYTTYFHQMDPVLRLGMRRGGRFGEISRSGFDLFRLADVCDYRNLTQTEYYQDFFRPNHIHHVLVLAFRLFGNRDQVALLGFHRPSEDAGFSQSDMMLARQAAPALLSTLRGMTLENALRRNRSIVDGLETAARDIGVVLLNQDFSMLYANARGYTVLGLPNGLDDGHEDERRAVFIDIENHCKYVDWNSPDIVRNGQQLTLGNDERAKLNARVRPLMGEDGMRTFLITTDHDEDDGAFDQRMNRFGLTGREKEISVLVARGNSNQEIANSLCISIRTTENHLRSIYSKVEVKTRSQLIFRLYTGS